MNARSTQYLRGNKKKKRRIADDKLKTKELLSENGIAAAELISVVKDSSDLEEFDWDTLPSSFVIKPNRGLGGEGILVIYNRLKNGNWLTTNKRQLSAEDLEAHVRNILDGNFSLLNTPDQAIFEARLSMDPLYKRFSTEGIPDIRVIVYNNVPVMAMLRVPTKKSKGKANMAQGGLGIGIDITTGFTTHAVVKSWLYEKEIETHPDSGAQLRGIKLPYWDQILKTSVLTARVIGLKYCGVDVSVDKKRGPVVLEANARPGLGIQVANMAPLRERLRRIRGLKVKTPERGIAIAKELFAGHFDDQVESVTGRQVIGLVEQLRLLGKNDKKKSVFAKIDTGADDSSIDIALAKELGFEDAVDLFYRQDIPSDFEDREAARTFASDLEKKLKKQNSDIARLSAVFSSHGASIRMHIRMKVVLAGHSMTITPNVYDRGSLTYPVLIGQRNLSHFLIDTTKKKKKKKKKVSTTTKKTAAEIKKESSAK